MGPPVHRRVNDSASSRDLCSFASCFRPLEEAATGGLRSEGDHDIPQIERVISQDDGYAVVEKLIAEDYMEETDPRPDGSDGSRPAGA